MICQKCNEQIQDGANYCSKCGSVLQQETVLDKNKINLPMIKSKFKVSKKVMAIGSACIALILVIAIVLSTLLFGNVMPQSGFVAYIKDGELFFTKTSKIKPFQVTNRLFTSVDEDDRELYYPCIEEFLQLSNDGKILFYIDEIEESAGSTFSLFYRYVNKPKKAGIKISSGVSNYTISESGKIVAYLIGDDYSLYQYNLKEKDKIDNVVSEYKVSKDGKKIVYLTNEGGLYFKKYGKDKEKISADVSEISYIDDDFSTVYYMCDSTFYKQKLEKDKTKITADVYSVGKVYDSGEAYYLKTHNFEVKVIDYIEDDIKETDSAMVEPMISEYESEDEYNVAKEAWLGKQSRDEARQNTDTLTIEAYDLYYYNGKEEKMIAEKKHRNGK